MKPNTPLPRSYAGYVEPVEQDFKTLQNAPDNIPVGANWHFNRIIDLAVGLQPKAGVMYLHSVNTMNNPMQNAVPFVKVNYEDG